MARYYLLLLLITSLATHFLFFGQPNETVFDEVHFGKFISGYFTHEYFFDIHPPLGKLMISGVGWLNGFKPGFSFAEIGQPFPDKSYIWLRLLPALAGAILSVAIYFLALELGFSKFSAFAAGLLIALENALVTHSRLILLDSFLLLFGFAALLFYFKWKKSSKFHHLAFAGVLSGLAVSIKWTGATFGVIIVFLEILKTVRLGKYELDNLRQNLLKLLCLIVIPFSLYFSFFALHFSLLGKSGPGDAFMTPAFRKTLRGSADHMNPQLKPLNIFQKFSELNIQMYKSNSTLGANHPYGSRWYSWPFMARPIYYWHKEVKQDTNSAKALHSRIYFTGNPIIWWASAFAVFYVLFDGIGKLIKKVRPDKKILFLLGAFFINLLPFIKIKRVMFLYHYLTAYIFALLILVYLIEKNPKAKKLFAVLIGLAIISFVFFAPLSYGQPITENSYKLRIWFRSWE